MKFKAIIAATAMICTPLTAAQALTWQILDHGYGALGAYYGLRLDSLFGTTNPDEVFSASSGGANVFLTWDGSTGATAQATISGYLAYNADATTPAGAGSMPMDPDDGKLSKVSYVLSDLVAAGNGFQAMAGTGSVCGGVLGALTDCYNLEGKSDGTSVLNFIDNGHRLPGDNSTFVAEGWIDYGGTNDWLVKATVVPLPAGILLLLTGLGGLAALGRMRKSV